MPSPLCIPQDEALKYVGMWPYEGKSFEALSERERKVIYKQRNKLSALVKYVKLPGEPKTYRVKDLDKLVEDNRAAA